VSEWRERGEESGRERRKYDKPLMMGEARSHSESSLLEKSMKNVYSVSLFLSLSFIVQSYIA